MPNETLVTEVAMEPDKPYDGMSGIIFKRFSEPGCRGVVTDAHSMKYLDSGLFECQYAGVTYFMEFKCQHKGISVVYHTENSRSSATTGYPIWWLTDVWKTMSYGRCVDTLAGSIHFTHALPKEVVESLGDCLEAKPSTYVNWYRGKDCDETRPHGVYLEKRISHDGCIDTVSKKYFRYGQTYACVDNALVESYYPDYGRCSVRNDPTYSSHKHFWTYRKWKRFTEGECVKLDNDDNSMKVTDPRVFGNIRQIIEQTQCGNPVATWNMFSDRACAVHLLGQEIVTRDISGCIHLTGCNQVKKLKACKVNASFVKITQHSVGGCLGLPEASGTITMRDFKKLRSGKCTVMRPMPPASGRKISYQLDLHSLPSGDPMPNPFLPLATCPDAAGEPERMSDAESPAPASDPTPPRDAE